MKFSENKPTDSAIIYLKNNGDGTYSGEGDIVWLVEGPTYMGEVINNPVGHNLNLDTSQANSVLTISSAADTLTTHFSQSTAKLAWQIGSFSIIVLEPAFEAILLKEERPTQPQQPNKKH
ncbi:hypothetical protein IMZ68_06920 [Candidatus Bathyarchaeota archaeon]|nr:hypothetical protein [Candidatus Bathyarchaeota archaeon]